MESGEKLSQIITQPEKQAQKSIQSCRALPQYMSAGVSSKASCSLVSITIISIQLSPYVDDAGTKYKGRAMGA